MSKEERGDIGFRVMQDKSQACSIMSAPFHRLLIYTACINYHGMYDWKTQKRATQRPLETLRKSGCCNPCKKPEKRPVYHDCLKPEYGQQYVCIVNSIKFGWSHSWRFSGMKYQVLRGQHHLCSYGRTAAAYISSNTPGNKLFSEMSLLLLRPLLIR